MSLGYADRLSQREDLGGRLGDPELFDPPHVLLAKAERLAELVQGASKIIAFTGAGISTASGIPDFRGPQGVWTLQRAGRPPPQLTTSFLYAQPSLTHMALLGLMQGGKLTYICSQNVDSLHLRSGVPRFQLAELHGNCFAERCQQCRREYVRDFEMDTVGFKPTGRLCAKPGCRGQLADHILDWEDALPPAELRATQQHASAADLAICLGTSLQIIPAANLPLRTVRAGGRLAIINLQATPKDKKAEVVLHGKVDEVMALVMQRVGLPIPSFTRSDSVTLCHTYTPAAAAAAASGGSSGGDAEDAEEEEKVKCSKEKGRVKQERDDMNGISGAAAAKGSSSSRGSSGSNWGFTFSIQSVHGSSCPLPMVAAAWVSFVGAAATKPEAAAAGKDAAGVAAAAVLPPQGLSGELPWKLSRSCPGSWGSVTVRVELQLVAAADEDKRRHQLQYVISRPPRPEEEQQQQGSSSSSGRATRRSTRASQQQQLHSQIFSFVTQIKDYSERQAQLVAQIETAAEESRSAAPAAAGEQGSKGKGTGKQQQASGAAAAGSRSSEQLEQSTADNAAESEDDDDDDDDDEDVGSSEVEDAAAAVSSEASSDAEAAAGGSSDSDGGRTAAGSDQEGSGGSDSGVKRRKNSGRPKKRTKRLDL